jgi:hypothetical protein
MNFHVMAGLVPAIHAFLLATAAKTWMPGTRPGMTKKSSANDRHGKQSLKKFARLRSIKLSQL